ncbi:MAG TPA: thiamine-phosphate kinase [Gammaproteobacteria bacterium]|nr:thiamine-phosphate kinase [Gammaproteobacteria bacterium]HIK76608.1 thiamine-phosphate kinase [Gammaproteobacteria bacterium]
MREADIISALQASIDQSSSEVIVPIGDDGSVIATNANKQLVTTTDAITVDIHYPKGIEAKSIGHRCLAINLSDMAAMGASAKWASLVFSMPSIDSKWVEDFIIGFSNLANDNNVDLIGGDTIRGPEFFAVSLQGYVEQGQFINRTNAKEGDLIYMTGHLGSAAYGLELIINNNQNDDEQFIRSFLYPSPRTKEGILIAKYASAMIDISDGFYCDLGKISSKLNKGFKVDVLTLPIEPNLIEQTSQDKAINLALTGGDDYELCFTVPEKHENQFLEELTSEFDTLFTCVGQITESKELLMAGNEGYALPESTFEHFSS